MGGFFLHLHIARFYYLRALIYRRLLESMTRIKKIIFLLLFTITSCYNMSYGQNSKDSVHTYLSVRYHSGFILPHHTTMMYWIEDYTNGLELTYGFRNYKSNHWSAVFNYPEVGLGFYTSSLGNDEVFGQGYALFPYINFHIWRKHRFETSYKIALGLGYVDTHFDVDTNPEDLIIGSALNAYVGLGLLASYRLHENFSITAGINMNHFSNGAAKKPNYGANIASANIGLKYHFDDKATPDVEKTLAPRFKKHELILTVAGGSNQLKYIDPEKYWSGTISANYLWYRSAKRAWGLGADIMYMGGAPHYFEPDAPESESYNTLDHMYGGIVGSYNLFVNKVTMVMQMGVYVFYKIKPIQPVYPRLGIRYDINDKLMANFTVKASFFSSEYLEFGLAYKLHQ